MGVMVAKAVTAVEKVQFQVWGDMVDPVERAHPVVCQVLMAMMAKSAIPNK